MSSGRIGGKLRHPAFTATAEVTHLTRLLFVPLAAGLALTFLGCAIHAPVGDRQLHLVLGADVTPPETDANMSEATGGVSVPVAPMNTFGPPDCLGNERPGTTSPLPLLSVEFRERRLIGVFIAEERNQSTMLDLLCQARTAH